jgi:hypothetical protein
MWIVRLCRALLSSMGGQETNDDIHSNEVKSGKDISRYDKRRRGEYFRLDVEFEGSEPRLDDASKMGELKVVAYESSVHSNNERLDRLAHCIVAEYFVFELDSVPRRENGQYSCIGHILCRLHGSTFEALLSRLARSSAVFLLRGRPLQGQVGDRSSMGRDGIFRKRVCFTVGSKQDPISLQLREGVAEPHDISGSPFSVDWLVKAQGLERAFNKRRSINSDMRARKRRRKS